VGRVHLGHRHDARRHTLDDERVLVFFHSTGRGKTSGLDLAQMHSAAAGLFHVRDSKVTKFVVYLDRDRALADLGLQDG
jgi:hypothetical protein